jgi:hypothetical protein
MILSEQLQLCRILDEEMFLLRIQFPGRLLATVSAQAPGLLHNH